MRQYLSKLVVRDRSESPPRADASVPERLGAPDIPDPRDEPLVEERLTEGAALRDAPELVDHRIEVERVGENVRAEPAQAPPLELEHGAVPEHSLPPGASEDQPRPAYSLRVGRDDAPASVHPQVAPENAAILELEQQVLSHRASRDEHAAVDPLGNPERSRAWMRSFGLDALADKGLELARGAME
jgi:hypothetical protein